jgi:hypothetical protein
MRFHLNIILVLLGVINGGSDLAAEVVVSQDTVSSDSNRHDPYDLDTATAVDSTDVYYSRTNYFLAFPKYLWSFLVYPLGLTGSSMKITSF